MENRYELDGYIDRCIDDMKTVSASGEWSIDAQVRLYDLLSALLDIEQAGRVVSKEAARRFCDEYEASREVIATAYDENALLGAVQARLAPLERACTDARFEAASAASLHEFAKETYEVWQTAGIFMRKRALKALRERVGFRLESHRIGNYVAKTFDLMNEAQMHFARAQQKLFAADVRYKVKSDLGSRVVSILDGLDS